MRQDKVTNSLLVDVTATLSINLDGTWNVIAFDQKSIKKIKQTTTQIKFDDSIEKHTANGYSKYRKKLRRNMERDTPDVGEGWVEAQLKNVKRERRRMNQKRHNWNGTKRDRSHCSSCAGLGVTMRGFNKLTHVSAGVHRTPEGRTNYNDL